jgi:hypothetical protein
MRCVDVTHNSLDAALKTCKRSNQSTGASASKSSLSHLSLYRSSLVCAACTQTCGSNNDDKMRINENCVMAKERSILCERSFGMSFLALQTRMRVVYAIVKTVISEASTSPLSMLTKCTSRQQGLLVEMCNHHVAVAVVVVVVCITSAVYQFVRPVC